MMSEDQIQLDDYFHLKGQEGEVFEATFEGDNLLYDSVTIDTVDNVRIGSKNIEDLGIHEMQPKEIIAEYAAEDSQRSKDPITNPDLTAEDIKFKTNGIKEIDNQRAEEIIDSREPKDRFVVKENNKYIAIDNSSGNAWTEEFKEIDDCIDYLNGKDIDKIREGFNRSEFEYRVTNMYSEKKPKKYIDSLSSKTGEKYIKNASKEELSKLYNDSVKLMNPHNEIEIKDLLKETKQKVDKKLDLVGELKSYKSKLGTKIEELEKGNSELDLREVKEQIAEIDDRLNKLDVSSLKDKSKHLKDKLKKFKTKNKSITR